MRSLQEAEEVLRRWDAENWQHPPGNPTAYHTTIHLAKAVFRALAHAQRSSPPDAHHDFLRQFFDEIAGRLIEHSLRLCRASDCSIVAILTERPPQGNGFATAQEWANHHGEAAADDMDGTFVELMNAMTSLIDLQERAGHGEAISWRTALGAVPALLKGALGASTNFLRGRNTVSRAVPGSHEGTLVQQRVHPRLDRPGRFHYPCVRLEQIKLGATNCFVAACILAAQRRGILRTKQ